ncbi:MAG: DUF2273 domain-containing protein [Atopobiaceae bacterium]|jgi:uncharacterized membrane protein|nr:DUF2273 domain-containing protein [Atopobiaceae bacterium]MCI2173479.1 DUF2273 domain-containing protein [Atopobiaceae bacterium]MCI2207474.1 DUF2273 domain-containing protein [Atopobiaceae bacterium]
MASTPKSDQTDPKRKATAPKATVESADSTTQEAPEDAPEQTEHAETDSRQQGKAAREAVEGAAKSATSWLEGVFPGHGNAALFAIIGFVVALFLFGIGFWNTLLLVILVVAGLAFGQYLDGDPKILNVLKGFFSKR